MKKATQRQKTLIRKLSHLHLWLLLCIFLIHNVYASEKQDASPEPSLKLSLPLPDKQHTSGMQRSKSQSDRPKSDFDQLRKNQPNTSEEAVPNPFPVEVLEDLFQEKKFITLTLERSKNHKIIKDFLSKDTLLLDVCGEEFKSFHLKNKLSAKDYYYFFLSYFDQSKEERLFEFDGHAIEFTKIGSELYSKFAEKVIGSEQEERTIDLDRRVADWLVYEMALYISRFLKDQLACSLQFPEIRKNPGGIFLPPPSLFDSILQLCRQPQFLENEFSIALEKNQYGRALQLQKYLINKEEYNQLNDSSTESSSEQIRLGSRHTPLQRARQELEAQVEDSTLSSKQETELRDQIAQEGLRQFEISSQLELPPWLQHTREQLQQRILVHAEMIKTSLKAAHFYEKKNNLDKLLLHCSNIIKFLEILDNKEKLIIFDELFRFFEKRRNHNDAYLKMQQSVLSQFALLTADQFSSKNCQTLAQASYHIAMREQDLEFLKQAIFYVQKWQQSLQLITYIPLAEMHGLAYQLSQSDEKKQYFLQQVMYHLDALLNSKQEKGIYADAMSVVVPMGEYIHSIFLEKLYRKFSDHEEMCELFPIYYKSECRIMARGCLQRALILEGLQLKQELLNRCIECCNVLFNRQEAGQQAENRESFKDLENTFIDAHTELVLLGMETGTGMRSLKSALEKIEKQFKAEDAGNIIALHKKYVALSGLQWEATVEDSSVKEEIYQKIDRVYKELIIADWGNIDSNVIEFCSAYVAGKLGHYAQKHSQAVEFFVKSCQHYEKAIKDTDNPDVYDKRARAYSYYWLACLTEDSKYFEKTANYFREYLPESKTIAKEFAKKSEQEKVQYILDYMRLEETQISLSIRGKKLDQIQQCIKVMVRLCGKSQKILTDFVPFYSLSANKLKWTIPEDGMADVNKIEYCKLLFNYCLTYGNVLVPEDRWNSQIWSYLQEEEQIEQLHNANVMLPFFLRQPFENDAKPQDVVWELYLRQIFDAYQGKLFCYHKLQEMSKLGNTDSAEKMIQDFYVKMEAVKNGLSPKYTKVLNDYCYKISNYDLSPLKMRLDFFNVYLNGIDCYFTNELFYDEPLDDEPDVDERQSTQSAEGNMQEILEKQRNTWLSREATTGDNVARKMQALMFWRFYDEKLTPDCFAENLRLIWEQLKPYFGKTSAEVQITDQYVQILQATLNLFLQEETVKDNLVFFEILDLIIEKVTDNYWVYPDADLSKTAEEFAKKWKTLHIADPFYQENMEIAFALFLEYSMKFYVAYLKAKQKFDYDSAILLSRFVRASELLHHAAEKSNSRGIFQTLVKQKFIPSYIRHELCCLENRYITSKEDKLKLNFSNKKNKSPTKMSAIPVIFQSDTEKTIELVLDNITASICNPASQTTGDKLTQYIQFFNNHLRQNADLGNARIQFLSVACIGLTASQQREPHDRIARQLLQLADLAYQIALKESQSSLSPSEKLTLEEDTGGKQIILNANHRENLIKQYRLIRCTNPKLYFAPSNDIFQLFLNDGLQIYASLLLPVAGKTPKLPKSVDILPKFAQVFIQNQGQISDQTRELLAKVALIKSIKPLQQRCLNQLLEHES